MSSCNGRKPDALVGTKFINFNIMSENGMPMATKQGTNWAAGIGGAVVGGLVGYQWGKDRRNCGCGNNGCNGNCGTGYNGCSENTPVNRFELEQSEKMANKDAEIAYLRGQNASKEYTNAAILELRKELIARDDKQDTVTANLIQSSIDQQVNVKGLQTGLTNLADSTAREFDTMATSVNKEFANVDRRMNRELVAINERFATERSISDCRYVMQPRVRICGSKYELECDQTNPVVVSSVAGTVKTTK